MLQVLVRTTTTRLTSWEKEHQYAAIEMGQFYLSVGFLVYVCMQSLIKINITVKVENLKDLELELTKYHTFVLYPVSLFLFLFLFLSMLI